MYKQPVIHVCENCGKEYTTLSPKSKCCSKTCAKHLWYKKVNELGHNVYQSGVGRKKGITPWNKDKKCAQLSGENNGFYGKSHTEETKQLIRKNSYITKRKNNSFHISKEEQCIKEDLFKKFPTLKCQYKCDRYPFNCDFYIPQLDLFIEYQGHWTHGIDNHKILGPYDPFNYEHQLVLEKWRAKHTKYFDIAIKVWTQIDPLKQQYAEKNNLNLLKFYTYEKFSEWLNKLD